MKKLNEMTLVELEALKEDIKKRENVLKLEINKEMIRKVYIGCVIHYTAKNEEREGEVILINKRGCFVGESAKRIFVPYENIQTID